MTIAGSCLCGAVSFEVRGQIRTRGMGVRLLITGAPGSGTTTLGRALVSNLNAVFIDADDHFWLPTEPPYKVEQAGDLRLRSLLRALNECSASVVAGSVVGWGEELENSFSHIIYLWVPADVRVARLIERESKRFGKPLDGFIEWAEQYDEGRLPGRSRAIHERWLAERTCPTLRIEGELSVSEAVARVMQAFLRRDAIDVDAGVRTDD